MRIAGVGGRGLERSHRGSGRWIAAWIVGLALALCPAVLTAAPGDQDITEDFEGFTPNTSVGVPFVIGPGGGRAQFGGNAFAGDVGGGSAHGGTHAWVVVNAASDGTITFLDAPASVVEFYASTGSSPFGMIIRAYAPGGALIGSPVSLPSGTDWTLVSFTGPVDHIDVTNTGAGDYVYLDDFGYSVGTSAPVPLLGMPGIAALVAALALSGWVVAQGRRRAA